MRSSAPGLVFIVALTAAILGVDAGLASAAQLTATWTDNAGGTAGFRVERRTGTAGTYAQIATTAPGATSHVDTTVAAGTTYCYRVRASNAAGDSAYSNEACAASASVGTFDVTVAKAGTGAGSVVSSPSGISCGTDCVGSFAAGALVTLTPTPAAGSVFGGWSGGGCAGTAPCVAAGNTAVKITATFSSSAPPPVASYTLTVAKSGTGAGTVVSSPGGINCGADCSEGVRAGTTVTLTASPASGSTFSGWSGGGCSGSGSCAVTVNASATVNAVFSAATSTTYSLWAPSARPTTVAASDRNPVTLGVKFRADVDGDVTGIRFYKGSANTGRHVGSLWTTGGTLLATVTFTNESASGWQEAKLGAPVRITAGRTYIVSYHTTVGRYSADSGYFSSRSVSSGPLRALSSSAAGGNGVYRYGSGSAFPNQTYNANNYWVDVVFRGR